jgi:hypothetical protein
VIAIANIIANALALLFAGAGLLHVTAPYRLRMAYRRWQFGRGFHYVVGIAQLFAALFLAIPQTRIWGGFLAGTILFVTVVSLLNHRKYFHAAPAILILLAVAPAMAGSI